MAKLHVGMTKEEIGKLLGPPFGESLTQGVLLLYPDGIEHRGCSIPGKEGTRKYELDFVDGKLQRWSDVLAH